MQKRKSNEKDFEKKIFVGITFTESKRKNNYWKEQLKEIERYKITQIALFPTTLKRKERKALYQELENSGVKEIKLVHLREQDFSKEEIEYLIKRFKTKLFNCHESSFDYFYKKVPKLRKNILLELNYNNYIDNKHEPKEMGGFCIDCAHLMAAKARATKEWDYVKERLQNTKFQANHLNGYSKRKKRDLHFVTNKNQFDYLKELPKKIFSNVIGLELENSIKKQLEFKKYIVKILNKKFKK